jgi:hypothetical protein
MSDLKLMRGVNLLISVGVPLSVEPDVIMVPGPDAGGPDLITSITNEPVLSRLATGKTFNIDPGKQSERLYYFAQNPNGLVNESMLQPTGGLTVSLVYDEATGYYDKGLAILKGAAQGLNKKVWLRAERFLKKVGNESIYDVQMGLVIVGARMDQNAQSNTIDDQFTFQGTGAFYQGYIKK